MAFERTGISFFACSQFGEVVEFVPFSASHREFVFRTGGFFAVGGRGPVFEGAFFEFDPVWVDFPVQGRGGVLDFGGFADLHGVQGFEFFV